MRDKSNPKNIHTNDMNNLRIKLVPVVNLKLYYDIDIGLPVIIQFLGINNYSKCALQWYTTVLWNACSELHFVKKIILITYYNINLY